MSQFIYTAKSKSLCISGVFLIRVKKQNDLTCSVSISGMNGKACGLHALADGRPRKFVVVEVEDEDCNKRKVLRIASSSDSGIFHKDIVAELQNVLSRERARCTPLYGGKIVVSEVTGTVVAGGNSIAYPDKMNPYEVAELLRAGMHENFKGYRILCKEGLDDVGDIYESII